MKRALAIATLLLAACSSEAPVSESAAPKPAAPAPPSAEQTRELLASSAELGEYEFTNAGFTTPVAATTMSEPVRQSVQELVDGGWLARDGDRNIILTERSRNDKRFLLRPNGLLDIIPLAKKELLAVQSVASQPDGTLLATFSWRWLPNEVGSAFKTGLVHDRFATEQDGKATLMWDGTSWIVLKIE